MRFDYSIITYNTFSMSIGIHAQQQHDSHAMALLVQFLYITTLRVHLSFPSYTTQRYKYPTQDVSKHHSTPTPGDFHAGQSQPERRRPNG